MIRLLPLLFCLTARAAIQFDGVDDYVSFSHVTQIDNSQTCSILFWAKPATDIAQNGVAIGMLGPALTNGIAVQWLSNDVRVHIAGDMLSFTGTRETGVETTNHLFTTNAWHHIGVLWNGAASNVSIYVDGVGQNTIQTIAGAGPYGIPERIPTFTANLFVGDFTASSGAPFKGAIDDVRFTNVAISQDRLLRHYHSKTRFAMNLSQFPLYCLLESGPHGKNLDGQVLYGHLYNGTANDGTNNTGCASIQGKVLTWP